MIIPSEQLLPKPRRQRYSGGFEDHSCGDRKKDSIVAAEPRLITREQRSPFTAAARGKALIVQTRHLRFAAEISHDRAAIFAGTPIQDGHDVIPQVQHDAILALATAEDRVRSAQLQEFPVKKQKAGMLRVVHFFPAQFGVQECLRRLRIGNALTDQGITEGREVPKLAAPAFGTCLSQLGIVVGEKLERR